MLPKKALALSLAFFPLFLSLSCSDSSDSKSPPAQTAPDADAVKTTETNGASENAGDGKTNETAPADSSAETPVEATKGPSESPLQLSTANLEFQRLQFDCGDVRKPIADASVNSLPSSLLEIKSLAATIPAKDKALLVMKIQEGATVCDYRALFGVNKGFSEITFESSQALDSENFVSCANVRAQLDSALSQGPVLFDYDRTFIRWVAVRLPENLQTTAVCPSGPLRVVFAAKL